MTLKSKVVAFAASLLFAAAVPAGAAMNEWSADIRADMTAGTATSFGVAIGGGYEIVPDLQLRGDLGVYSWDTHGGGFRLEYDRIPVALGVRKYVTFPGRNVRLFAQAGPEISFDDKDRVVNDVKFSDGETNLGFLFGAGGEYVINRKVGITADVRFHALADPYATFGIGASWHF